MMREKPHTKERAEVMQRSPVVFEPFRFFVDTLFKYHYIKGFKISCA